MHMYSVSGIEPNNKVGFSISMYYYFYYYYYLSHYYTFTYKLFVIMGLRSVSASEDSSETPLSLEPTIVNNWNLETRGTGESVGRAGQFPF